MYPPSRRVSTALDETSKLGPMPWWLCVCAVTPVFRVLAVFTRVERGEPYAGANEVEQSSRIKVRLSQWLNTLAMDFRWVDVKLRKVGNDDRPWLGQNQQAQERVDASIRQEKADSTVGPPILPRKPDACPTEFEEVVVKHLSSLSVRPQYMGYHIHN